MSKPYSEKLIPSLVDAGLITDPNNVTRVVIDIQGGHLPVVHVQHVGDERLINVFQALEGIEIERREGGN